jgi:hypothetical protein
MYRNSARNDYIYGEMNGFTHNQPLEQVWAAARVLLFESGFQTRDAGGGYYLETEWSSEPNSKIRYRYMLTGVAQGTGCTVYFTKDTENSSGSASTGRDYAMEWELVKRVDPQRAAKISSDAEAYAHSLYPD